MKIGLVCPYNIHRPGGVLEVVLALKSGLQDRGHEVRIITPKPRRHREEPETDVIYAGTSIDFRTLSFKDSTSQVSSTVDNEQIDAMLAEEQFDILHFHEPWQPLLSRQLLQRSTAVNIATFHSTIPDKRANKSVLRAVAPYLNSVLKYLDVLTAVSDSGASYASSVTKEPISIIPNGIDIAKYHEGAAPYKKKKKQTGQTVFYVGRLEPRKGVKYLIKAFQLLSQDNPDAKLIIAGDGPDREKLELLADDLKLKNVSFLGFISEELKIQLLAEADLFVSPALYGESFGIVLLEAMAAGTVCIAGNNSGYIDVMQGLGALSIVNPQDTEELARRMNLLLHEQDLRTMWQDWAADYIKQFDYPKVVDQYEELYKESIKHHARES